MALEWLDMFHPPERKGDGYYLDLEDWEINVTPDIDEGWFWWVGPCEDISKLVSLELHIDGYSQNLEDAKKDSLTALFGLKAELKKYTKSLIALEVQLMIDR